MFAMMTAGVLGQQAPAVGGGGPDYVEEALSLGATAVLDGAGDLSSDAVWTDATLFPGPDGLTAVKGADATITLPAGLYGEEFTIIGAFYADPFTNTINTLTVTWPTGPSTSIIMQPRRDAAGVQRARASFIGTAATPAELVVSEAPAGFDSRWTLIGISVSVHVGGTNTDITSRAYGADATLAKAVTTNRAVANFPRPNGDALVITFPTDIRNMDGLAGMALFDRLLTDAEVESLADTLPSLVAP